MRCRTDDVTFATYRAGLEGSHFHANQVENNKQGLSAAFFAYRNAIAIESNGHCNACLRYSMSNLLDEK